MKYYGDIIDKNNIVQSSKYGRIDEFFKEVNSYKLGISDGFVKAFEDKEFIYTSDIRSCVVLLIIMDNEYWMVHLNVKEKHYDQDIKEFLNNNKNKIIRNVYFFPGIKTELSVLEEIEKKFKKNKISYLRKSPFYDSRYGCDDLVGGIGCKLSNHKLFLFGIDSEDNIYSYDLDALSVSNREVFFDDNVFSYVKSLK